MQKNEAALILGRLRRMCSPAEREALHVALNSLKHSNAPDSDVPITREPFADVVRITEVPDYVGMSDLGAKFVAIDNRVMRANECVAVVKSATYAKRIANALNIYRPNRRGQ